MMIRFPAGQRVKRAFYQDEPLQTVVEFVTACEYLDASITGQAAGTSIKVPSKFTLSTNFPTKTFGEGDYGQDLKALGLVPNAMLLCQELEEEEDEG